MPKSLDAKLNQYKSWVGSSWLPLPDQYEDFPTNEDHFAAQEITRLKHSFHRLGFLCQLIGVLRHNTSEDQLNRIVETIGGERILIVHGALDRVITVPHAETLYNGFRGEDRGVTKEIFEDAGHYIPTEKKDEFPRLIEGFLGKFGGNAST